MNKLFPVFLTLSLLAGASGVVAEERSSLHPNQSMEGGILEPITSFSIKSPGNLVTDGHYAYVDSLIDPGAEVMVLDILNPEFPDEIASIPIQPYDTLLAITGDTLYMGRNFDGLLIYDISEPANPELLRTFTVPGGMSPKQMVIVGNLAYVADFILGLAVLDITDPVHPILIGTNSVEINYRLAIQGQTAYTLSQGRLIIYDISNPALPTILGRYEDTSRPYEHIAVAGDYAYLSGVIYELEYYPTFYTDVMDISNPNEPERLTDLPQLAAPIKDLIIEDDLLYAVRPDGLRIFNMTDPLDPQQQGAYPTLQGIRVEPRGDQTFLLDNVTGLHVIDTSDPNDPGRISFYSWPQRANYLVSMGTNLYSLSNDYGVYLPSDFTYKSLLQVIDASDPFAPRVTGFLALDGRSMGRPVIDGSFVYAPMDFGVEIIDVSDVENMQVVARTGNSFASAVEVYNRVAYSISKDIGGGGWFTINDVSNPVSPKLLSQLPYAAPSDLSIAIQGEQTYAYILYSYTIFVILDVTDPEQPVEVYRGENAGYGEHRQLTTENRGSQTIAYIYSYDFNYYDPYASALDVSDPAHPIFLGVIGLRTVSHQSSVFDVREGIVYISQESDTYQGKMILVDFTDPAYPYQVASAQDLNGPIMDAAVGDHYMFTTTGWSGICVFSLTGEISGHVTDHNGKPFEGITLNLSTGAESLTGADGTYIFSDLDFGDYVITPTQTAFAFAPAYRQVNIPSDTVSQDFVILPAPVSAILEPDITTSLIYTDVQGLPTSFIFPAGLISATVTVLVTPTLTSGFFGESFAGHAFELALNNSLPGEQIGGFTLPVSVTIQYSLDDTTGITDTAQLALYTLEGSSWVEADTSCLPAGTAFVQEPGMLQGAICEEGQYALLGPTFSIALPLVSYGAGSPDCEPPGCALPLPPLSAGE